VSRERFLTCWSLLATLSFRTGTCTRSISTSPERHVADDVRSASVRVLLQQQQLPLQLLNEWVKHGANCLRKILFGIGWSLLGKKLIGKITALTALTSITLCRHTCKDRLSYRSRAAGIINMNQPVENRPTFSICNSSLAHTVSLVLQNWSTQRLVL